MWNRMIFRKLIGVFFFLFLLSGYISAKDKVLKLMVGESRVINIAYSIKKIAIGNPMVADVTMVSKKEILINGTGSGTTSLLVWNNNGGREKYYLQVSHSLLPEPLIQLQVQIIEVKVGSLKKMGIQWADNISFEEETIPGIFDLGTIARMTKLTTTLNMLLQEGEARILAKPNLVSVSGGKADFHVGGEIPFIVPQDEGRTSVEWKKYGITLEISPTGDEAKKIIATGITVSLSLLDYDNAVKMEGYLIPAITERRASTQVQVPAGSTIVIAGLKQTIEQKSDQKVPILGDIPLLKYFFRVRDSDKGDTEVTVFITPTFIKSNKK
ncbi:pilus assembly protein N-terminal domain-containing protein [bacterium]|nr:pilus assembly protein N-terminal domain-containing protein [bacterium]